MLPDFFMFKGLFSDNYFVDNFILTIIFGCVFYIAKRLTIKAIRTSNKPWTAEQRLRWIGYSRSISFSFLILGILFIWGEQLHNFAVSVFAIAFALVFSVKELFMCFNGAVMRFRGSIFTLGDRIEIAEHRGDVIDFTIVSTTLLEVGPGNNNHHYTGRIVSFPNSLLLENFVINESFMDHFFLHNICIPMQLNENWKRAKEVLLKIATEECTPFLDEARKRVKEAAKQKGIQLPSVEPRITIQMKEPNRINLLVRIPAPVHLKGRLEQTVLNKFLEEFYPFTFENKHLAEIKSEKEQIEIP